MGLISSLGKRPSRLHSSMMGMRFSSMNLRVLSRTSRSSSPSSVSNSMKSTPLNLIAMPSLAGGRFAGGTDSRRYQAAKSGVKREGRQPTDAINGCPRTTYHSRRAASGTQGSYAEKSLTLDSFAVRVKNSTRIACDKKCRSTKYRHDEPNSTDKIGKALEWDAHEIQKPLQWDAREKQDRAAPRDRPTHKSSTFPQLRYRPLPVTKSTAHSPVRAQFILGVGVEAPFA